MKNKIFPEFCECDDLPDYFVEQLKGKQIKNITSEQLYFLFSNQEIFLEQVDLYVVGRREEKRKVFKMRILSCEKQVLKGKHEVMVNSIKYEVDSLSTMKKRMGFDDKFSFERVSFILIKDMKLAIRLSTICHLCTLPLTNRFITITPIDATSEYFFDVTALTICERTRIRPFVCIPNLKLYYKNAESDACTLLNHLKHTVAAITTVQIDGFMNHCINEIKETISGCVKQIEEREATTVFKCP